MYSMPPASNKVKALGLLPAIHSIAEKGSNSSTEMNTVKVNNVLVGRLLAFLFMIIEYIAQQITASTIHRSPRLKANPTIFSIDPRDITHNTPINEMNIPDIRAIDNRSCRKLIDSITIMIGVAEFIKAALIEVVY